MVRRGADDETVTSTDGFGSVTFNVSSALNGGPVSVVLGENSLVIGVMVD